MAINATQRATNLHPITVITLPDKNQKRVACKVPLDQCCTDKGLISQELVEMLDLPTTKGTPRIFTTAAGTVSADRILKIDNAMLPCLSTNRTFTAELMVIPSQKSSNYEVILGEESMRALDLDTSVRDNTISWGDKEIPMVPRDYWTMERILRHKARLHKQPLIDITANNDADKAPTEESNATGALQAVTYKKANLEEVVQSVPTSMPNSNANYSPC